MIAIAATLLFGFAKTPIQNPPIARPTTVSALVTDPNSYANFNAVRVRDLRLDLTVSFAHKRLSGFAELALDWQKPVGKKPAAKTLVLDTRALEIESIYAIDSDSNFKPARFRLSPLHKIYGQKLTIELPARSPRVRIVYRTTPAASGLQWLAPEQTLDKSEPFLFSQSQAIHARSWVPLQDTPAVRFTYTARVHTQIGLLARMSADNHANDVADGDYRFAMPQPIPSYLLALAVGKLEFRSLGARSGVYAEPGRIEAAAAELVDTEAMIDIAEKLYGPYRWGRYDMLVLPPSFPFGGMENPRLTFLTPTFIAGDKSLVSLIAHELAHSWSGNLVTNANWESIWLNEGFTTYVQSRIVEAAYGPERERMETALAEHDLLAELIDTPVADQNFRPNLKGRDPDDGLSGVPYDKGHWFLRWLEESFGRDTFDPFLRAWFDQHAFQSVTTDQFLGFLQTALVAKHPGIVSQDQIDQWVEKPGIPTFAKAAVSIKFVEVDRLIEAFIGAKISADALPGKDFSTQEWLRFLNGINAGVVPSAKLSALDAAFKLTGYGNSEVAHVWFLIAIKNAYQPADAALEAYLLDIGRRKLIVPLYRDLYAKDPTRAKAIYAKARPGYHPITQVSLDAILR
jgi:leukotriene-A4 hydrolase